MKNPVVVQINTFSYKSTGTIMLDLQKAMLAKGIESYVVWGRGRKPTNGYEISIEDKIGIAYHGAYSRITDKTGFCSKSATSKLLRLLDNINPDIVHLHNLHGYYINIEMLFKWLRERHKKVIWTLHDCWPFTGHCAHFDYANCDKWKHGCSNCTQKHYYPKTIGFDNSKWNWNKKKEIFSNLDMIIVTPSQWLARYVRESFLQEYDVIVINNGVDLETFHKVKSDFREKYSLENKNIILGVASDWTERKGLHDYIKLQSMLKNRYFQVVLVGLNDKQMKSIPKDVLALHRTSNANELAMIYSTADCFVNFTYEDTYPTVNLEAIACGTPVVTYRTGGSPEIVSIESGEVFEQGDINSVAEWISDFGFNKKVISRTIVDAFNKTRMIDKYLELYQKLNRGVS